MTIFRSFRRLVESVEMLGGAVDRVARAQEEVAPAVDRLEALELSRHQFEAMMDGLYLKAEGKLKAASNAEARERQLKRSYERHIFDELDPDSEEGSKAPAVLSVDAPPSEEERVHGVRLGMAPNNKAQAIKAKWGR